MIKKIIFSLLGLIAVLIAAGYAYYRLFIYQPPLISDEDRAAIKMMPLPAAMELDGGEFKIKDGINISFRNYSDEKLERAASRFLMRLSESTSVQLSNDEKSDASIIIDCLGDSPEPVQQLREDESYNLKISSQNIVLHSNSPYGTLRGLETLLQLLEVKDEGSYFPALELNDEPRFPWRGLMIDVSRHWMPKEVILRNLDAMASVKLNVLHLHLTDDQGFRIESKSFPKLHELGSNGKYYTQADMQEIIDYARDRGIRIVPEFGIPGHTKSWLIAYPEYASAPGPFQFGTVKDELFSVPMDPTSEELYLFLDGFFDEMSRLFPDRYFHIGGDEVNPKYWDESAEIKSYMNENNLENSNDLQAYLNSRIKGILEKHGKIMIGWEEILHPDLGEDAVIQSWRNQKSLFEGVQKGGAAILSTGLYLDHKLHASQHYSVDPLILPGVLDIEPDTLNWKMFDMKMDIPGNIMETKLILFDKDPQNVSGFFAMMDSRNSFKNGTFINGDLSFEFSTPMGELGYSAKITGDSIKGQVSLGPLGFDSWGSRTGGSDIAGTRMPKVEVMKPLTEEEKARILGAEAAMWSELVSPENIDSRLWPRTAAIAEKLWSPAGLTTDEDDMYRRLGYITGHLTSQGVIHETNYEVMIRRLAPEDGYQPLKVLIDVLEEVKYYNRMSILLEMDSFYLPDLALDGVADVAKPESMIARRFNKIVDEFIADPDKMKHKDEIIRQLATWESNHEKLIPFISESKKLQEIEHISAELSSIAKSAIQFIDANRKVEMSDQEKSEIMATLAFLENGENGVLLAVTPGLRLILFEL